MRAHSTIKSAFLFNLIGLKLDELIDLIQKCITFTEQSEEEMHPYGMWLDSSTETPTNKRDDSFNK